MRRKNNIKTVNIKLFIFTFIFICSIFIIMSIYTVKTRISDQYNQFEADSVKIARGYSHSLSSSSQAKRIINELLEDKIRTASKSIHLFNDEYSNETLIELALQLEVDEVNIVNDQKIIVYSNKGYTDFVFEENHPAYDYLNSSKVYFMEDIRKDIESELFFKYGYYRSDDGRVIQIGVSATTIQNFLGSFEIQHLLDEIDNGEEVEGIYFIDNNYTIIGSTDERLIDKVIKDDEIITAIREEREWGFKISDKGHDVYETHVPVYIDGNKLGTLVIQQSTEKLHNDIVEVIGFIIIMSVTILASIMTLMLMTYSKSKRQMKLTYYDSLTNLPNKYYLKEFLSEKLKKDYVKKKAILLVNCVNFRTINLTYGMDFGDEILKVIGMKLKKFINENDMLFKFTADRFILYIESYERQFDLGILADKINNEFKEAVNIEDEKKYLNIQVGMVEIQKQNTDVDQILKDALIVIDRINNDETSYGIFDNTMIDLHKRENIIENELRMAIAQNNAKTLYLEFQPQLDLNKNKVVGFEALARMQSKSLGAVSPLEFIHIAEKNHFIVPLGNYILKQACDFIKELNEQGFENAKVSVNISVIQLLRDDFVITLKEIINSSGINYHSLELEITESVFLDNYDLVNKKLGVIRKLGIKISLDDFGTGFSSLARLKELNVDILKIDRYFINSLSNEETKIYMAPVIISIAHKLGLIVVAEGVELNDQKIYLLENRCDIMQGFLFSKPISKNEAINILINNK